MRTHEAATMEAVKKIGAAARSADIDLREVPAEATEEERAAFLQVITTELTPEQIDRIVRPAQTYPRQDYVLAVHWHPEQVPMDLLDKRLDALYPHRQGELIIPTQHNVLMRRGDYFGVEVDCYSRGFNRKVQLLLHFKDLPMDRAEVLSCMLKHTFKYRSSQLFEYLNTLVEPDFEDRLQQAAAQTNTDEDIVGFVRVQARKLKDLLVENEERVPDDAIKNKLVRNFFDALRHRYHDRIIDKAQVFLKAVKEIVKRHFSLDYFYRASEVIEEARALGAGIVIPHPEQFWPILLADYDVDGIEVWNPQSQQYTEFLINVVNRRNRMGWHGKRPILIFMGDDCHMSEKLKRPEEQDPAKAVREVGLQPAWDDYAIRKSLIINGVNRKKVIEEYRARLS
jgi:hypothetical protein